MASTPSQVKAGLLDIANRIVAERSRLSQAKAAITTAESQLTAIPNQYAGLFADIDALTGTDPTVLLAKDEKAKLGAEFAALKTVATNAKNAIASIINGT